jgi:hypothetical protein
MSSLGKGASHARKKNRRNPAGPSSLIDPCPGRTEFSPSAAGPAALGGRAIATVAGSGDTHRPAFSAVGFAAILRVCADSGDARAQRGDDLIQGGGSEGSPESGPIGRGPSAGGCLWSSETLCFSERGTRRLVGLFASYLRVLSESFIDSKGGGGEGRDRGRCV